MLSRVGWWIIRLNNELVFPDPELPIINILYELSESCGQFGLCSFVSFF